MIAVPPRSMRFGMTAAEYQRVSDDLKGQGYRLADVSGYGIAGEAFYAGIWEQSSGQPWRTRYGMTAAEYQRVSLGPG
jgi:hypothetical protein